MGKDEELVLAECFRADQQNVVNITENESSKVIKRSPRLKTKVIRRSPNLKSKVIRRSPRLKSKVIRCSPRLKRDSSYQHVKLEDTPRRKKILAP